MVTTASLLVEAYRSMRRGALLLVIAWLLLGVGLLFLLMGLFAAVGAVTVVEPFSGPGAGFNRPLVEPTAVLVAPVVVLLVGAVTALIGLWAYFVPGVERLAEAEPEFSTPADLIRAGLFYGLIVLVVGVLLRIAPFIGVIISLIGFVLLLVGYAGLVMLCFKLNDFEYNTLYLVAGILFIVAAFIPLLGFVAWILLYIALGDSIEEAKRASQMQVQSPSTA